MRSNLLVLCGALVPAVSALAQAPYSATPRGPLRGQPYAAWEVADSLGRTIHFYLSEAAGAGALPLAVYVQGSGHQSNFRRADGRVVPANGHATLTDAARGRARVLVVEKPGVELYEDGAAPPSPAFRAEHTLDRWAEAVAAALIAARRLPGVDTSRLLIVGHSEGALVAARVAARLGAVTHVGILAGGGPSQLFDLHLLARNGRLFGEVSGDPEARVAWLRTQWDSVLADPGSADRDFFGHTYRRWSSFLADSPMAELRRTRARVFVAQGSDDAAVSRESFEALVADLQGAGRHPDVRLVPGADHSFLIRDPGRPPRDGWSEILSSLLDWYLRG